MIKKIKRYLLSKILPELLDEVEENFDVKLEVRQKGFITEVEALLKFGDTVIYKNKKKVKL